MAVGYAVSRVLDTYPHLSAEQVEADLAYGSFASVDKRLLYIEVPKAASTVIKNLLRDVSNAKPLRLFVQSNRETRRDMFVHARENVPIPPLTELDDALQREILESPDVLRFTVVRNPHTRLVSAWRDKVVLCEPSVEDVYSAVRGGPPPLDRKKTILGFAEFVSHIEGKSNWDGHWRRQVDITLPHALSFTHIGKVEQLSETAQRLAGHLGLAVSLQPSNESALRFPAMYSAELAARVHALYAMDFAEFDYDPESWPQDEPEDKGTVSRDQFVDGIIERNIIISHLYQERDRLLAASALLIDAPVNKLNP